LPAYAVRPRGPTLASRSFSSLAAGVNVCAAQSDMRAGTESPFHCTSRAGGDRRVGDRRAPRSGSDQLPHRRRNPSRRLSIERASSNKPGKHRPGFSLNPGIAGRSSFHVRSTRSICRWKEKIECSRSSVRCGHRTGPAIATHSSFPVELNGIHMRRRKPRLGAR
jgi:hypothetical protein